MKLIRVGLKLYFVLFLVKLFKLLCSYCNYKSLIFVSIRRSTKNTIRHVIFRSRGKLRRVVSYRNTNKIFVWNKYWLRILWAAVRVEAGGVWQPQGELHHGCDPREGRQWQPSRVRAAHLPHTDHRGGWPKSAEARATGPARSTSGRIRFLLSNQCLSNSSKESNSDVHL